MNRQVIVKIIDFGVIIMLPNNFEDLIDAINKDLKKEAMEFQYFRKKVARMGRVGGRTFLRKMGENFAYNQGGSKEIQFHVSNSDGSFYVGLAFNTRGHPPDGMTNVECILPYIKSFIGKIDRLSKEYDFLGDADINVLSEKGLEDGRHLTFGKSIKHLDNGYISQNEYDQIIYVLRDMLPIYMEVIEEVKKGESITKEENMKVQELVDLLKESRQIILTGAPGTGKTYLAKEIAKVMTGNDKVDNQQIGFCQFHPSFDYTDFVEGLRPDPENESGTVGFSLKDGIFKAFCRKAILGSVEQDNFDEEYAKFIDEFSEEGLSLKTPVHNKPFKIKVNKNQSCIAVPETESATEMTMTKETVKNYIQYGIVKDWKPYITSLGKFLIDKYKFNTKKESSGEHVFIIDEINRGDISKIFGELFFSIDAGYRGEAGKVQTQYANLIDSTDIFHKGFYVPENVYIIGTMNDIDRSVESMDFAIRRRFTWKEILADDNISMWDNSIHGIPQWKEESKVRMQALNKAISEIDELGDAYHIGPAYFLKLKNHGGDFAKLWDMHLLPLLREYLRGVPHLNDDLKKLENAYNKKLVNKEPDEK